MNRERCPDLDSLSPFLDGELTAAEDREIRIHLARCPRCSRRIESIRALDDLLLGAAPRRSRRLVPLGLAGMLAASLLVAVWLARPGTPPTGPAPVVRPATLAERVAAIVQAEAAGDPDSLAMLRSLGPGARMHLRDALRAESPNTVRATLRLVVALDDRSATGAVIDLLDREELESDAARALGDLEARDAVPDLVERFREGGPPGAIASAMGRIGGKSAERALLRLVDTTADPARRAALFRGAGEMRPERSVAVLSRHPDDPIALAVLDLGRDATIRALRARLSATGDPGSAEALGRLGDVASRDRIARLLDRPATRLAAARGLVALGDEASCGALLAAHRGAGDPIETALAGIRPAAERFLVDRFDRAGHDERRRILRLLGRCGGDESLAVLSRAAGIPALSEEAIRSLGRLGTRTEEALGILARLGDSAILRPAVIHALAASGHPEAVTRILDLAVDRPSALLALDALAAMAGDEAIDAVLDLMDRPSCASAARRALRRHGDARVAAVRERRSGRAETARHRTSPEV